MDGTRVGRPVRDGAPCVTSSAVSVGRRPREVIPWATGAGDGEGGVERAIHDLASGDASGMGDPVGCRDRAPLAVHHASPVVVDLLLGPGFAVVRAASPAGAHDLARESDLDLTGGGGHDRRTVDVVPGGTDGRAGRVEPRPAVSVPVTRATATGCVVRTECRAREHARRL